MRLTDLYPIHTDEMSANCQEVSGAYELVTGECVLHGITARVRSLFFACCPAGGHTVSARSLPATRGPRSTLVERRQYLVDVVARAPKLAPCARTVADGVARNACRAQRRLAVKRRIQSHS